jgi:transposase
MARPVLRIRGYTPEQIKSLIRKDERYTIGLRLYAVYQVSLGQPSRKLEELYNTSFKQITNWVHRFEQSGTDGLRDKAGRGRKSRLDGGQLAAIKEMLLKESPERHGFNTATWTGPLLIIWIGRHYGIEYKKAQIYNIIRSLGLTYQKGRGLFPEANAQKQDAFKEGLKKTAR